MADVWLLPITLTLLIAALVFLLVASILERASSRIQELENRLKVLRAELDICKRARQVTQRKVASLTAALRSAERDARFERTSTSSRGGEA